MSLKQLKALKLAHLKQQSPNVPEYAIPMPKYEDKTANGLTRCIIDWINLNGGQAERISSSGRYIDGSKVVSSHIGQRKTIGSGKWIPGNSTNGSADISATIKGRSVKIEVKIGKDKMSPAQEKYKADVERAGGLHIIGNSFDQFLALYNDLCGQPWG